MRILVAHNLYQQAGGEDKVVDQEIKLLRSRGHVVKLFKVSNYEIKGFYKKLTVARNACYSISSYADIVVEIELFQPDIVHVHNFFPLISPSIYDACIQVGVPVVQTLHNYRLVCPGGLLSRNGKVCELCVTGSAYYGTVYACYRGSFIGSFFVSNMINRHRKSGTWRSKVDRYIALTEFARSKFIEGGLPSEKITVKPNFYATETLPMEPRRSDRGKTKRYALFVGRLGEEKGLKTLLEAWETIDYPLHVVGAGPLLEFIEGQRNPNVICLGSLDAEEVSAEMLEATFMLLPSEWYEGFPMVIVEAFAHALPVIASRIGSMAEIIDNGKTGLHFEVGDSQDLADKVNYLIKNPDECKKMAGNTYNEYLSKYTAIRNYSALIDIYSEVVSRYRLK